MSPVKRHKRKGVMSDNSNKKRDREKGDWRRARKMPKGLMTAVIVPRWWPLYADEVAVQGG